MRFDELKLTDTVLRAVRAEGYDVPTPIQQKAIPHILAGKDLMGCAQTGTGKTAAFALPILCRLAEAPAVAQSRQHSGPSSHEPRYPRVHSSSRPFRVLVLTPTRELAVQIGESFATYGKYTDVRVGLIFGGVGQGSQEQMLRAGVDVVVATPGRLMDMMSQRLVDLSAIEVFVLDEADRMLDMGFIADIRKVISRLPVHRQNLMFSATMPAEIKRLADGILRQPVHVAVAPVSSTAERVKQSVYLLERRAKSALLMHLLKTDANISRVLIFTRTKHGADRLAKGLNACGVPAEAIHGNKSQNQRQRALDGFKQGQNRVLVATDIAARGLDIEMVSHVINYELPNIPESYVHRIGRTARAGESGVAISFCDPEEREFLRDIERLIGAKIPVEVVPSGLELVAMRRDTGSHSAHRQGSSGGDRRRAPEGRPPGRFSHSRPQRSSGSATSGAKDHSGNAPRNHSIGAANQRSGVGSTQNQRPTHPAQQFGKSPSPRTPFAGSAASPTSQPRGHEDSRPWRGNASSGPGAAGGTGGKRTPRFRRPFSR